MFTINEPQTKILGIILDEEKQNRETTASNSKKDTKGITGYKITKKISRGTWYENKDYLQYYQLITRIQIKITGKQKREYFKITPLGVISFFKRIDSTKLHEFETDLKQIFQLIGKHWISLSSKLGDDLLYLIFSISLNQIDLIPSDIGNLKSKDPLLRFTGRKLTEKIELPFDIEEITFNIFTQYTTLEKGQRYSKYIKNYDEITNSVVQHLIFLFFYNLLRMKTDDLFLTNTMYSLFLKQLKVKKLQRLDKSKIKYANIEDNPIIQEYVIWMDKQHKIIMSGLEYTHKLIKSDNELSTIFEENIEFISKKIKSASSNHLKKFDF